TEHNLNNLYQGVIIMYTRENQFNVGDIVRLKSGGPDMTIRTVVRNISEEFIGFYDCQWFAGKKLESGRFPEESLELIVNE
ncbi:YodC family protein, partial [Avibacterium gallinarum]|uniref:YodC family protein n=2 Tax=Avibacterium gallinarum TaxID=755 RepID=UPI003BF7A8EB